MNILFVCRHNRFRSKVAEALFRHHYKGDSAKVKSAGLIIDTMHPYISRTVHSVLAEKGISIRDSGATALEPFLFKWADKIIIVADNVTPDMFRNKEFLPGKPISIWPVGDVDANDARGIRNRIVEIERYVVELVKNISQVDEVRDLQMFKS